ncbi:ubiquitin carboxyl-terminal hydrolase domain-containing protein [Ditylenchus destructor]|uniref:ubiquitinyl hydrolase 1 n=1 Tax=Ditylenchus destructor TaxID=166010 RepID=A0AAD4N0U3_9BILA|nr:ubiquitin carboxyl-terminal hydrolase domain-containing protein [Ditylenchus destructor]
MENNSQSDNGQSQEIEPVVCKKARPMDNGNSMIAIADIENIVQSEGPALTAPQENQKVYKDECVYCYRTPFFPGGLYVCLKKFVALCPHHIGHYAEKHPESRLYLAMKYELQEKDEKKEVVRKHALVAYPNIDAECDIDGGKIPEPLLSVLQAVIDHKSAHIQQNTEQGLDWDGTEVYESDLVNNLIQLDVQKSIPEGGWVCEQEGCDIRQNLWLNLSDAVVMCGRYSHGSKYEGRAHAEAHSRETGFPLVVRVATIENEVGECFQYVSQISQSGDMASGNPENPGFGHVTDPPSRLRSGRMIPQSLPLDETRRLVPVSGFPNQPIRRYGFRKSGKSRIWPRHRSTVAPPFWAYDTSIASSRRDKTIGTGFRFPKSANPEIWLPEIRKIPDLATSQIHRRASVLGVSQISQSGDMASGNPENPGFGHVTDPPSRLRSGRMIPQSLPLDETRRLVPVSGFPNQPIRRYGFRKSGKSRIWPRHRSTVAPLFWAYDTSIASSRRDKTIGTGFRFPKSANPEIWLPEIRKIPDLATSQIHRRASVLGVSQISQSGDMASGNPENPGFGHVTDPPSRLRSGRMIPQSLPLDETRRLVPVSRISQSGDMASGNPENPGFAQVTDHPSRLHSGRCAKRRGCTLTAKKKQDRTRRFEADLETQQYVNDRYVKNPHLKKQLAHFGLDINKFEKTEEHRDVLNMEYNQTEFFAIQEQGTELQAVYGPGFTGLINLGSSCYINSLIQVLGTVPDFMQYCANQSKEAFKLLDPVQSFDDFTFQLVKLMCCLNSTDYSQTASELNGIKPVQFRRVAGKDHPEFSTTKQQDVEQYARHIFEKIDAVVLKVDENPVNALRFIFRTRFQDVASQHVRYREHRDCILPVTIPIDFAEQSATDAERKDINLEQCLMATFADGFIDGYESPITHERKGALETIRMGSFPDYLLVQLKRFTYTNEGTQQKMMVDVNNVDEIDLSAYLSHGLQPGEQPLPGEQTSVDDNLVAQVMEMGFDLNAAKQAVCKTKNAGAEVAVNWLMDHLDEIQPEAAPGAAEPSQLPVREGNGSYELQAFISHIGSKPDSGHYVAHIKKGDSWYIFNDEKVAVSQNPPKAMGYIYLYKRK